ncbi:hypothetical protein D3C72_1032750 [compost metagenome]
MKYSLLILLAAIQFSCSKSGKTDNSNSNATDSLVNELTQFGKDAVTTGSPSEMLTIGSVRFQIFPSTKEEFNRIPSYKSDSNEVHCLQNTAGQVLRSNDSLIFKTLTKGTLVLKNDTVSEGDNYVKYTLTDDLKSINQWLVFAIYYEAYDYILVDKSNGKQTHLIGLPVVSPTKKYVITVNEDLEAQFTFNGIELLESNGKSVKLIEQKEITDWAIREIKWLDNSTLLAHKIMIDKNHDIQESYIKLVITK